jgi:hypothetical protein
VLVWSDAVYHPEIARLARDVYQTIACQGGTWAQLALVHSATSFACPQSRRRLAPLQAGGSDREAIRRAAAVYLRRPLCDPFHIGAIRPMACSAPRSQRVARDAVLPESYPGLALCWDRSSVGRSTLMEEDAVTCALFDPRVWL